MASITIDEAANYLNVSTRTISTYIADGILCTHKKQGSNRKYLYSDDVHDLLEARKLGTFSIREYNKLRAKVKKLESQMEVILLILDAKQESLGFSAEYGKELLDAAKSLKAKQLSTEIISAWTDIFLRIDESDLDTIKVATNESKPWIPFLKLCTDMIVTVVGNSNYKVSLELQNSHKLLVEGRRRLRLSALLFLEQEGYDTSIERLDYGYPDTTVELVKKILKKRA
jgi:excisionase family DNA binding protein